MIVKTIKRDKEKKKMEEEEDSEKFVRPGISSLGERLGFWSLVIALLKMATYVCFQKQ